MIPGAISNVAWSIAWKSPDFSAPEKWHAWKRLNWEQSGWPGTHLVYHGPAWLVNKCRIGLAMLDDLHVSRQGFCMQATGNSRARRSVDVIAKKHATQYGNQSLNWLHVKVRWALPYKTRKGWHKSPVIPVVGNLLACLKGKIHMGLSTRSPLRLVTTRCWSPADNETRSTLVAATDRGAHNDR
jgi:hypothetical protein